MAAVPVPSAEPEEVPAPELPPPARVVTVVPTILRIWLLVLSATYKFPAPSAHIPAGLLNLAVPEDAFTNPETFVVLPTKDATEKGEIVILRIRLFPASAT